jgi:HPt (histidine-containing phosphotransfer) domain-containing protein
MTKSQHDMMNSLRQSYVASFPQKLAAFSDAVETRQFEVLSRLGHQLKGSGTSYGFPELSQLGQAFEDAALIEENTCLKTLIPELEQVMKRIAEQKGSAQE